MPLIGYVRVSRVWVAQFTGPFPGPSVDDALEKEPSYTPLEMPAQPGSSRVTRDPTRELVLAGFAIPESAAN